MKRHTILFRTEWDRWCLGCRSAQGLSAHDAAEKRLNDYPEFYRNAVEMLVFDQDGPVVARFRVEDVPVPKRRLVPVQ